MLLAATTPSHALSLAHLMKQWMTRCGELRSEGRDREGWSGQVCCENTLRQESLRRGEAGVDISSPYAEYAAPPPT